MDTTRAALSSSVSGGSSSGVGKLSPADSPGGCGNPEAPEGDAAGMNSLYRCPSADLRRKVTYVDNGWRLSHAGLRRKVSDAGPRPEVELSAGLGRN